MRKLAICVAALMVMIGAGVVAWQAQATTPSVASTLGTNAKTYSLVHKAACRAWGRHCPPGFIWTCGPARCWCRPC
jgi:hypothetical protein